MPKIHESPFVQRIDTNAVVLTAANTNRLAPITAVKIATASAEGGLLTRLESLPLGDVTATELQVYTSTDGGTTKRLVRSSLIAAQTATVTTARVLSTFADISENAPLYLKPLEEVWVALGVATAAGVSVRASVGQYV